MLTILTRRARYSFFARGGRAESNFWAGSIAKDAFRIQDPGLSLSGALSPRAPISGIRFLPRIDAATEFAYFLALAHAERSMKLIERSTVEKVAILARIAIPASRLDGLVEELRSIVEYVDQLAELDVADVAPLTHAVGGSNVYRDDEPGASLAAEEALANAPDREDGFYRVRRVIEEV